MKALVYHGPEDLRYEEIDDVAPKKGEVKIKIKAVGICGSDVHGYLGLTGRRIPPMVMGHEFSGQIVELGEGVTKFKVGDKVVPYPVEICYKCELCKQGKTHICLNKRAYGVLDCNGAMAEYICVPEDIVFKIDDRVSYSAAAMVEPMAVAHRGVNNAGDLAGKNVFIVGAGTIGLFTLVLAKMQNPAKIFISDLIDTRLEVAKRLGADVVINPSDEDPFEVIKNNTNGLGVDVALEAVGVTSTVKQALSSLKFGGTAVWIGNSAKFIEVNMQEVVTRELKIFGSFLYTLSEFKEAIDILKSGKVDVTPIISKEISLDEGVEMFRTLAESPDDFIKVVITQ